MSTYFTNIICDIRDRIRGYSRGFTIIELLVAMTIFSIVVTTAIGIFVRGIRTQRAIVSFMEINDNASLALEQMMREMRTGKDFNRISEEEIRFTNADGKSVSYRKNNDVLERGEPNEAGDFIYGGITAENVALRRFSIGLLGGGPGAEFPARVTISLAVGSNNPYLEDVLTNIQTTVSSRFIL
ncbi:type II secretion system protein [Candidatus Wolfebacteria bacterium]|nr:type II secretion system protein [Candidatus Wolfebacteria bacterium]